MSQLDVEDDVNDDINDDGLDVLDDMPNLFWHMDVTTNSAEMEGPEVPGWMVHITNACFGTVVKSGSRTVVLSQDKDGKESPLCVLLEGKNENVRLDLLFSEPVKLVVKGKNASTVSLTGYLQPPPGFSDDAGSMMDDDMIDLEDDEEEQQINNLIRKRKLSQAQKEEEEEAPELIEEGNTKAAEPQTKRAKLEKAKNDKPQQQQQQQQQPKQNPKKQNPKKQNQPKNANQNKKELPKNDEKKENPSSEKKESTNTTPTNTTPEKKETTTNTSDKKDKMISMKGGIQYKDLKQGEGNPIETGQKLKVYFVGQLEDKSTFDKVISGEPFSIEYGKGTVVKGLDMGIKGMKIGGKRRIVIPAKLAYGEKGSNKVPPNSALTYTIEIKSAE